MIIYLSMGLLLATVLAALLGLFVLLPMLYRKDTDRLINVLGIYSFLPIVLLLLFFAGNIYLYTTDQTFDLFLISFAVISIIATIANFYLERRSHRLKKRHKRYFAVLLFNLLLCVQMFIFTALTIYDQITRTQCPT